MADTTQIPSQRVPVIDPDTGLMSREWYRFFYNLYLNILALNGGTPPP